MVSNALFDRREADKEKIKAAGLVYELEWDFWGVLKN